MLYVHETLDLAYAHVPAAESLELQLDSTAHELYLLAQSAKVGGERRVCNQELSGSDQGYPVVSSVADPCRLWSTQLQSVAWQ